MDTAVLGQTSASEARSRDFGLPSLASLLCAVGGDGSLDAALTTLLDALPQGVVVVASEGEIIFVNRTAQGLSKLEAAVERDLWLDVWDGGALASHLPAESAFARRVARGESFDEELTYLRDPVSGRARWLAGSGRPLRDPQGNAKGGVLILEDVTERFSGARALAASQARFEQIAQHVDDGFWVLGELGERLLYGNAALERILGSSVGALRGEPEPWLSQVHPEDRAALRAARQRLFSGGEGFDEVYRLVRPDGALTWVRDRATSVRDPWGEAYQVVGALTDVTELQEAQAQILARTEALERSNSALEHFASAVSHDLRQPARMVASYTELLAEALPELSGDARQTLEHARDGALRMSSMVKALYEFSRVGADNRDKRSVDLLGIVDRVLRDLASDLEAQRAQVEILPPLPVVTGYPALIERLLSNLIANAAKFSGARPARIWIFGRETNVDWQISVRDEGLGIPEAQRERIFQPFVRLHAERPGDGMGLAIARRVAEVHRGALRIWSEPGQGSCFTFVLPKAMS